MLHISDIALNYSTDRDLLKPAAVCVEVLAHDYLCKEERGKPLFHKLKEDKVATFPLLSFFFFFLLLSFFFLVAIAAGAVG